MKTKTQCCHSPDKVYPAYRTILSPNTDFTEGFIKIKSCGFYLLSLI